MRSSFLFLPSGELWTTKEFYDALTQRLSNKALHCIKIYMRRMLEHLEVKSTLAQLWRRSFKSQNCSILYVVCVAAVSDKTSDTSVKAHFGPRIRIAAS